MKRLTCKKSTQQLKQTELDLLKNENQKFREKVKVLMQEKGKLETILTEINRSSSLKSAGNKGQGGGKIPTLVTARPEDRTHEASAKMTSQNSKQKGGQKTRSNAFNARETHAPCLKCGEINHDTRSCRHRSPVTCWGCGFSGHKQQHCWKHA